MFEKVFEIREHSGAVFSLAADELNVYSAAADRFVTRWNRITAEQDRFAIRFEKSPYQIALGGGHLYVGLNDGHIHQIDLDNRVEKAMHRREKSSIFSLCLNEQRNHLYAGDSAGNLTVYATDEFKPIVSFPFGCGKIREIKLSPDGKEVFAACQDGKIRILDSVNFNYREIHTMHHNGANTFCVHPNSHWLITGGKDGHIRLIDIQAEKEMLAIPAHNYAVYRLRQIGGYLLSVSRDKTIKIWNPDTLEFVDKLTIKEGGHNHSINDLLILSSQEFVTCGDDRRMILWKLK